MTLIEHTAGASWHALSYTDTPEEALALKARYEQLPEVSRVVEVASLVPPDQDDKLPLLADIQRPAAQPAAARQPPSRTPRPTCRELQTEVDEPARPARPRGRRPAGTRCWPSCAEPGRPARPAARGCRRRAGRAAAAGLRAAPGRRPGRGPAPAARGVARRRRSPWPTCRRTCASATSARAASGCCASSPRTACGTSGRWSTSPSRSSTVDPEATGKPFGTVEGLKAMKNGLQRAGLYALLVIVAGAAGSTSAACATR